MKKLSTLFVLLLVAQLAIAQEFAKKINASNEDINNDKKKGSAKTWIARGDLFVQVAEAPAKSIMPGMDKTTVDLLIKGQQVIETKSWTSPDGETYTVVVYPDKELYYAKANGKDVLAFWNVTKTDAPEPLQTALEAYQQAEKLEPSNKSLKEGYTKLAAQFNTAAVNAYSMGDNKKALEGFQGVYACNSSKPVSMVDTLTMSNIGLLAIAADNYPLAEEFYQKAIDHGYIKGGDMYAKLAEVMAKNNKTEQAEKMLGDVYTKYPTNQGILIAIINFYMQKGEDALKVLPYIKKAQENEPTNSSLYYAEGMLYDKLKEVDKAAAAYKVAIEKDPKNFYAQYSLGYLHYQNAIDIGKEADALPLSKEAEYDALIKKLNDELKQSIAPFEAAYKLQPEASIAEVLKNVYYRFMEESPEMKQNYEKYNAIVREQVKAE